MLELLTLIAAIMGALAGLVAIHDKWVKVKSSYDNKTYDIHEKIIYLKFGKDMFSAGAINKEMLLYGKSNTWRDHEKFQNYVTYLCRKLSKRQNIIKYLFKKDPKINKDLNVNRIRQASAKDEFFEWLEEYERKLERSNRIRALLFSEQPGINIFY